MSGDNNARAEVGKFGEKAAAAYLRKKGYRIVGQNERAGRKEIDLVAGKRDLLVFIEVKTRTKNEQNEIIYGSAASAVTEKKQSFLRSAARSYLSRHPSDKRIRFDVIEVYVTPRPRGVFGRLFRLAPYAVHTVSQIENAF